MMRLDNIRALKKGVTINEVLGHQAQVDTPEGKHRLKGALARKPFPRFERVPGGKSGHLVRIDEDGTCTVGHLVGRKFVPA